MSKLKEIEMLKAALETDMRHQRNWIDQFREWGIDTTTFEEYLKDTETLYNKVNRKYFKLKAESESEKEISLEELHKFIQDKEITLVEQTTSFKTHEEIVKWDEVGKSTMTIKVFDAVESVDHCYESLGGNPYLYIETEDGEISMRMSKEGLKGFISMLQKAYDSSKVRR